VQKVVSRALTLVELRKATREAKALNRQVRFSLLKKFDVLLGTKSSDLHTRNSSKFADLVPSAWYGWQGQATSS
jgi:hypothetical protein